MCRIHVQKGLTREKVKTSSKGMNLRLRTSHHGGNSIQQTGDPKSQIQGENKVVNDGSALSINSIHSHDEDNAQGQGYNIKAC